MIKIEISNDKFRHDAFVMTKAFFPEEDLEVVETKAISPGDRLKACSLGEGLGYTTKLNLRQRALSDSGEGVERLENLDFRDGDEEPESPDSLGQADRPELVRNSVGALILWDGRPVADVAVTENEVPNSVAMRNELKRRIYADLSAVCDRELPWGALTGVRPTKLVRDLLGQGLSRDNLRTLFRQYYYVGREKTDLALNIAEYESEILSRAPFHKGYSLYVGIPFCPTTCLYCSFPSYPICQWKGRTGEYLDALRKEMEFVSGRFPGRVPDTIYVGGGTPTSLSPVDLDRLLGMLSEYFDIGKTLEFTVEAGRADSITAGKLRVLRKYGVGRISVNPQTMNDETLKLIGRHHTAEQVKRAFYLARDEGFNNINMDTILGLPNEAVAEVGRTMEEISAMGPDSLTVHSLALKRASRLNREITELGYEVFRNTEETMALAGSTAAGMGMKPYYLYRQKNMAGNFENTGFCRPGKEGLYNILIMEEVQSIIALGAGTVTKRVSGDGQISRCDTTKDPGLYIRDIDEMIERKRKLFSED
ncbi:MAG: coproporphyrinogen dehydrogenase HemZ [Lachnospiraceae bacterium]|nr:coproporphyrinogen dehydrogenase HemZ [Lachnospiraceae bacterium]